MSAKTDPDPFLRVIAVFKLMKAVLFFGAGLGLLHLFNKDVELRVQHLMNHLHVDPGNHHAKAFLDLVGQWTNTNLKLAALSIISFFYAILFGTEGVGLFLRRRWAEWFVVVVTSTLLPLEIYEIVHRVTALKIGVTVCNLIILGYLIAIIILRGKKEAK